MFNPTEGTWTLYGYASAKGVIEAQQSTIGANHQPYDTRLVGTLENAAINGTYITPQCTFTVHMTKF